ncbi:hypothetical protein IV102_35140 [bacterium]|nr:hypothetical protein [bacterium]
MIQLAARPCSLPLRPTARCGSTWGLAVASKPVAPAAEPLEALVQAVQAQFGEAFDGYLEGNFRGMSESRMAGSIAARLEADRLFRQRFCEYAGLPAEPSEREVLQALVDEVSSSCRSNQVIVESQELLAREAGEGLSGDRFGARLQALGVETDAAFHTDYAR